MELIAKSARRPKVRSDPIPVGKVQSRYATESASYLRAAIMMTVVATRAEHHLLHNIYDAISFDQAKKNMFGSCISSSTAASAGSINVVLSTRADAPYFW